MLREIQNRPSPGKGLKPFDPLRFALRRGWLIALSGLVLFLGLAPLALHLDKPYYVTGASLLINPEMKQFLAREEDTIQGNFNDYARTQVNRLQTDDVLVEALRNTRREDWPVLLHPDMDLHAAATILRTQIDVSQVSRTHLLHLNIGGPDPHGLAPTLNAIMDAYIAKLQGEQEAQSVRQLTYLQDEKSRLVSTIGEKKEALQRLSEKLNSSTFNDFLNVYMTRYNLVQENYIKSEKAALDAKALLEKAERDQAMVKAQSLEVYARESVEKNEALYLINNWTYQELQKLRKTIDGLTESNPDRIVVEERMNAMRDYLEHFQKEIYTNSLAILEDKRESELETDVIRAQSAFQAAERLRVQLEERLQEAQEVFESSSNLISAGQEIRDDIEQLRERLALVDRRISEVFMEAKAPVRVSIEARARTPGKPAGSSVVKYLAVFFVFAFGLTGSTLLVFDLLDGRIRQTRELKAAIGGKPLDPIGVFPEPEGFATCVERESPHPIAQYLRNLTVRLNHEREAYGSKVFLFTGTGSQVGTSSITANLASAFCAYSNRVLRISLADCGEAPIDEASLTASLNGAEAPAAFRPAEIILPLASLKQIKRAALSDFLREAREQWDVILLDCPPLLHHDLVQFLALHADAAILITRERQELYADLYKAFEFLVQAKVAAVSAVLNHATEHPLVRIISWKNRGVALLSSRFHRTDGGLPKAKKGAPGELQPAPSLTQTRSPFA